jgi:chitin disaccharide deacetylase
MLNMPGVEAALCQAIQECPRLGLGVHLVLTTGAPVLPAPQVDSMITENGSFFQVDNLIHRLASLNLDEVRAEWRAQIEKFISVTGHAPDHLDSHHHISYLSPDLFEIMLELAQTYQCAIRFPTGEAAVDSLSGFSLESARERLDGNFRLVRQFQPCRPDYLHTSFYGENATRTVLFTLLEHLPAGTTEIMCHPGYADEGLVGASTYQAQREGELSILTDPELMEFMSKKDINLINFGYLQHLE